MMTPWTWQTDIYGVDNLRDEAGRHVWLIARPPYCDRGHWELGGLGMREGVRPSLYFHHLDRARREAELWLAHGQRPRPRVGSMSWPRAWVKSSDPRQGRTWASNGAYGSAVFRVAPIRVEGVSLWELSVVEGLDRPGNMLDAADGFPRRFFDPTTAIREAQAFALWRLSHHPVTVPGPLVLPDRPVDQSGWSPSPATLEHPSPRGRRRPSMG